jgi:hypothetical protein
MQKEKDLRNRTTYFALRVVRMFSQLPKSAQVQVLGKQLLITSRQHRHAHPYDFGTDDNSGSKSGSFSAIRLNFASIFVAWLRCAFARPKLPSCAS